MGREREKIRVWKKFRERESKRERDIKDQVFSIQEGEQGFRSDKLLCKQPPQILPAGGSPSARCFVYQSAPIVLRGHWSGAPRHFLAPHIEKLQPTPTPRTPNHKIKVIISSHPHRHFHLFFLFLPPAPHSLCSPSCVSKVRLLKTSSFTSSPPASPPPRSLLCHPSNSCFVLGKTLFTKVILWLHFVFWPRRVLLEAGKTEHEKCATKAKRE